MFHWNKPAVKKILGLDIRSRSVRLVEIHTDGQDKWLHNVSLVNMYEDVFVDGGVKDHLVVSEAIKKAHQQSGASIKEAATCVTGSSVIMKKVHLHAGLNEDELESAVWLEANKQFSDIIDDIYLDFQVMGMVENDPSRVEVVIVACRKSLVETRIEVIKAAGLIPKIVDVDYYALHRGLSYISHQFTDSQHDKYIGLIDLGFHMSTFIVVKSEEVVYSRSQLFNGWDIIHEMRQQLSMSDWPCGFIEKLLLMDDVNQIKLTAKYTSTITAHVEQILQFFYSSGKGYAVNQMILCGDCALIPHIDKTLSKVINIPTVVADPFKKMKFSKGIEASRFKRLAPIFMLAAGLGTERPIQ